jgi:hypothetical protein
MIFHTARVGELDEGEHVETDMGYRSGDPKYATCPDTIWTEDEKNKMQNQV